MSIFEVIVNHFNEHLDTTSRSIEGLTPYIAEAAHLFSQTLLEEKKIICCTSGSSFAVGNQLCNNLLGKIDLERPSLPALFLAGNNATALSLLDNNAVDENYAKQIQALAQPDDLLFLISSSGKEPNLVKALQAAKNRQMNIVAITSGESAEISSKIGKEHVNISILGITNNQTLSLQFVIVQLLSELVEQLLFGTLNS